MRLPPKRKGRVMSPASNATVPQRTCVGCRTKRPQTQLVRCTLAADGTPAISRTAAGRGAWLCPSSTTCFTQAIKRRGFERAWKCTVPAATNEALQIAYEAMKTNMEN